MNIMQIIQMVKGGMNPMQTLMGMAGNNPLVGQAMRMVNGRTPGEIQQMVSQIAQRSGVDIGQMAMSLGLKLP